MNNHDTNVLVCSTMWRVSMLPFDSLSSAVRHEQSSCPCPLYATFLSACGSGCCEGIMSGLRGLMARLRRGCEGICSHMHQGLRDLH